MAAVGSSVVVLNPGIGGELPHMLIGVRQNPAVVSPAGTEHCIVDVPSAPPTLSHTRLQALQSRVARNSVLRRDIALSSLAAASAATLGGAVTLFSDTVTSVLASNTEVMPVPQLMGRFAGVALMAGTGAVCIRTGFRIINGTLMNPPSRQGPGSEMAVRAPDTAPPARTSELLEVFVEVESDSAACEPGHQGDEATGIKKHA
ncbi:MAG: hypothetical protein V4695_08610 [Pseudomonadota bacterium]